MFESLIPSYVSLLCAAAFSIFFTWMALLGNFFRPLDKSHFASDLTWRDLVALLLAFICGYALIPPTIIYMLRKLMPMQTTHFLFVLSHFLLFFILFAFFIIYTQKRAGATRAFWKASNRDSIGMDALVGLIGWIISLPVVIFVSQLLDIILYAIWGRLGADQGAVSFLKYAFSTPVTAIMALISIVIFAPILEEYLFRGALHAFLRKRYSMWQANICTSIVFALMHYSTAQGITNISLLASLFVLSLYIGYVFERQRSLVAPIILHMTFNFISALRIIGLEIIYNAG